MDITNNYSSGYLGIYNYANKIYSNANAVWAKYKGCFDYTKAFSYVSTGIAEGYQQCTLRNIKRYTLASVKVLGTECCFNVALEFLAANFYPCTVSGTPSCFYYYKPLNYIFCNSLANIRIVASNASFMYWAGYGKKEIALASLSSMAFATYATLMTSSKDIHSSSKIPFTLLHLFFGHNLVTQGLAMSYLNCAIGVFAEFAHNFLFDDRYPAIWAGIYAMSLSVYGLLALPVIMAFSLAFPRMNGCDIFMQHIRKFVYILPALTAIQYQAAKEA